MKGDRERKWEAILTRESFTHDPLSSSFLGSTAANAMCVQVGHNGEIERERGERDDERCSFGTSDDLHSMKEHVDHL